MCKDLQNVLLERLYFGQFCFTTFTNCCPIDTRKTSRTLKRKLKSHQKKRNKSCFLHAGKQERVFWKSCLWWEFSEALLHGSKILLFFLFKRMFVGKYKKNDTHTRGQVAATAACKICTNFKRSVTLDPAYRWHLITDGSLQMFCL